MSTNDTSEPAFPFTCQGPTTAPEFYYGLSMRDYFAAKALQGLLANEAMPFDTKGQTLKDFIAVCAYDYADAMLEARK